jgi:3-methylfumaryl-CoA hydratase
MWAGSRVSFPGHLALGSRVRRRSTIERIAAKSGRSGRLVFVGLRHELIGEGGVAIVDEQDLVYREGVGGSPAPSAGGQPPGEAAPPTALFRTLVAPNSALLFRYSALTFNAHRIHYDRPYATEVEGYPGLVVQGPLLATLMVDLAGRAWPERRLASFSFRGRRPIIEGRPFAVCADPESADRLRLWIADADGCLAMDGQGSFA